MSTSMRFNVLRVIMAREIDEKFTDLHDDMERQFDELAEAYQPEPEKIYPWLEDHPLYNNVFVNMQNQDQNAYRNALQPRDTLSALLRFQDQAALGNRPLHDYFGIR